MAEQDQPDRDRRNEMARTRTEQAERRTQLANERTLSAWVRTGLTMLIAAFAAARLLQHAGLIWLPTVVAVLFVVLSVLTFLFAFVSYRKTAVLSGSPEHQWAVAALIAVLLSVCGLGAFLLVHGSG